MIQVEFSHRVGLHSFHPVWNAANPSPVQLERPAPISHDPWHYRLSEEMHDWLVEHGYPEYIWYHKQIHRSELDRPRYRNSREKFSVEFSDPKLAVLFKLRWGGS